MIIPRTIEDITSHWLTQALRTSGVIGDEIITQVEFACPTDDAGRHKGMIAKSYQLTVQYDCDARELPQSFFVKLSTPSDPINRINVYRREVNFYQNYAEDIGMRAPQCYYSDIDLNTGLHVLLLEDLNDARCGSVLEGINIQDAEQAILAIAKFHAHWWGSPQLHDWGWDGNTDAIFTAKDFQAQWEAITAKIQCPVPDALQAISQQIGTYIEIMYAHHRYSPQTLMHFDFHVENLLFPNDGSPMAIIDWQTLASGRGAYDVVYNLLVLNYEERRQHEMRLLHLYHDTLVENGVTDYTFDDCYRDYVIGFFRALHIFIVVFHFDLYGSEAEGIHIRDVILPRIETFVADHTVEEILDKHRDLLAVV